MTEENKQINLRVKDGDQFYSNETTINLGPVEFILDFKCATHVQDVADHKSILLRHNVIILTPYHAKAFSAVLNRAVHEYEDKFGEINKPDELKKAENMVEKEKKKLKKEIKDDNSSAYFG